ncbi:MAG: hypothetical protein COC01_06535 [Bacteroidetes bacterium]|nr:GNAT family N-acetyltransferase [Bacteroidia bacterium]PCH67108.1 MAG: hypothetical protein COC01_06535 [Bacteroidota bacterium]
MEFRLRNCNVKDVSITYDIKKNALKRYIEDTWGWDENFQLKYHKEKFKVDNTKLIIVGNQEVGLLTVIDQRDMIFIENVLIIKKYQSKGIGKTLIIQIIDKAIKTKRDILLEVLKVNKRAMDFYERFGFKVIDETNTKYKLKLCVQ